MLKSLRITPLTLTGLNWGEGMAIYDAYGNEIYAAFDAYSNSLGVVYDKYGNAISVDDDPVVEPLTWNMSDNYKGQILDALDYIKTYKQSNPSAYALCQFNDIHLQFDGNEPNFIDYNKGYKVIDRMLFVGDIVNASNATQYANAVTYMSGASASKKLVAMGNHEYGSYNANNGNPETLYKAVINVECTYKDPSILIYYHDDTSHNVRFISLNYFYQTKMLGDSGHLLDMAQLNWVASVMESAGDKDIILFAHSMLNPFLCLESQQTKSSTATLQNYQNLIDMVVAYKARGTFSVTVDGTTYTHDFSECTGNFVMYTTGHYHALGYGDFGFNMFTCPTLGTTYGGSHKGFVFYLIDKALKTIKVIQCSSELTDSISFDYTY